MKTLLLWTYTLFLIIIWTFYIIANIHAKKFSNFSTNINKVLLFLFAFLLFLSISWYLVIIFWNFDVNLFSGNNSTNYTTPAWNWQYLDINSNTNW